MYRDKAKKAAQQRRYRERCRVQIRAWRRKQYPAYKLRIKAECLAQYGADGVAKCVGCGEEDLRILTLDHVLNDGAQLRKNGGRVGFELYRHLRKLGFPDKGVKYQALCMNCQWRKKHSSGQWRKYSNGGEKIMVTLKKFCGKIYAEVGNGENKLASQPYRDRDTAISASRSLAAKLGVQWEDRSNVDEFENFWTKRSGAEQADDRKADKNLAGALSEANAPAAR